MNTHTLLLDEILRMAQSRRRTNGQAAPDNSWFFEQFRQSASSNTRNTLPAGHQHHTDGVSLDLQKLSKFCIYLMKTVHRLTEPHLNETDKDCMAAATPSPAPPVKPRASSNAANIRGSLSAADLTGASGVVDMQAIRRDLMQPQRKTAEAKARNELSFVSVGSSTAHNATSEWCLSQSISNISMTSTSTPTKSAGNFSWHEGNRSMGNWSTPQRGGGGGGSDAGNRKNRSFQSFSKTPQQQQQQHPLSQARTPKSNERGGMTQRNTRHSGGGGGGAGQAPAPCLGDFIVVASKRNQQKNKNKKQSQQQQQQPKNNNNNNNQTAKEKKRVALQTLSGQKTSESGAQKLSNNSYFGIAEETYSPCKPEDARKELNLELSQLQKDILKCSIASFGDELDVVASPARAPLRRGTTAAKYSSPLAARQRQSHTTDSLSEFLETTDSRMIDGLARIYSTLIDLNLCTNVISEIGFMLNLLNTVRRERAMEKLSDSHVKSAKVDDGESVGKLSTSLPNVSLIGSTSTCKNVAGVLHVLGKYANTLYFAYEVLRLQAPQLSLLDLKSLGIVLDAVRPYGGDLYAQLSDVQQAKLQMNVDKLMAQEVSVRSSGDVLFQSVSFDEDCDSRQNFANNNDFAAFKTQRDLFYRALTRWDHLINSDNTFNTEITPLINEMFRQSDSTINMAHLARLFVAQLLLTSSIRAAATVEDIGVNVAVPKLSQLMQRFMQPGACNQEDSFPGKQEFFVHFIRSAPSDTFRCQLKMALYAELHSLQDNGHYTEMNDSGLSGAFECLVQWSAMTSMMVLAKFLGYVTSLPYRDVGQPQLSGELEQKQLILRNRFRCDLDVYQLLAEAERSDRLIVTLPWVVQYLIMLDRLSLKLDSYKRVVDLICSIYMQSTSLYCPASRGQQPATTFILRTCIGWLFEERPFLLHQYYAYLLGRGSTIQITAEYMSVGHQTTRPAGQTLNPNMECLITVACPFLSGFRTTLQAVPKKGEFRQVTTQWLADGKRSNYHDCAETVATHVSATEASGNAAQNRLIEAFIHSLNPTKRQLIEFLVDRIYKSAIRDAQSQLLAPAKARADAQVNQIKCSGLGEVSYQVNLSYRRALEHCLEKWPAVVADSMDVRIPKALDALLPSDTDADVQLTYGLAIKTQAGAKVENWRSTYLIKSNFFCDNADDAAQKIADANQRKSQASRVPQQTTTICLQADEPQLSEFMHELNRWLHLTSLRADRLDGIDGILEYLQRLAQTFVVHQVPTLLYYLLGTNIIMLTHNLLRNKPEYLDERYFAVICDIWQAIEAADVVIASNKLNSNRADTDMPGIYDTLVSSPLLHSFGTRTVCFAKFEELIATMLRKQLITMAFLNVGFVGLFKEDWDPQAFNILSIMLRNLSAESRSGAAPSYNNVGNSCDTSKSNLFMEMLADFAADSGEF